MIRTLLLFTVLAALSTPAAGEVADSAANGFTYKLTLHLSVPPPAAYQRLLEIGAWWGSEHTFSGDARNMTLDAKPMGCWCEKLPNRGGVRHMQVVNVVPGKSLVMTGGVGPLQSMGSAGSMTLNFSPEQGGTKLDITYAVAGYLPAGMNTLAPMVDQVFTSQFLRFKSYVDTGKAEAATAPKK